MCALSFSLFHSLSILSLSLSHNLIESYFSTEKKKMHEEENKQTKKIVPFSRKKNNHSNNNNDNNNNNIVVDFLVVFNVAFVHSFFASSTSPWRSEAPKVESMAVVLFFFFVCFRIFLKEIHTFLLFKIFFKC